ncbi:hypothetical protein AWZ03_002980 [Drosophila navojoa]|uniref:Uncharacterized protein n=1 Tax=Drosophila navojoa TaxID=7232 RepID=A0A484BP98_DRONA|nr:hypothetical protein AWZ03_002980 [Drosophila navojoa]
MLARTREACSALRLPLRSAAPQPTQRALGTATTTTTTTTTTIKTTTSKRSMTKKFLKPSIGIVLPKRMPYQSTKKWESGVGTRDEQKSDRVRYRKLRLEFRPVAIAHRESLGLLPVLLPVLLPALGIAFGSAAENKWLSDQLDGRPMGP